MPKYNGTYKPFFSRPKFAPSVKANRAQKDFWLPKQYTDAQKAHWVPPKVCGLAYKGWSYPPLTKPKGRSRLYPKSYYGGMKVHEPSYGNSMMKPKKRRF